MKKYVMCVISGLCLTVNISVISTFVENIYDDICTKIWVMVTDLCICLFPNDSP